jgi:hypothetical protein
LNYPRGLKDGENDDAERPERRLELFGCHGGMSLSYDIGRFRQGERMTPEHSFTLIVSSVGIAGSLGGIFVGNFLSKSSQRRNWILDCRKQEFRELVSALSKATIEQVTFTTSLQSPTPQSMAPWMDTFKIALHTVLDRIYIAKEMKELNVMTRFLEYASALRENKDLEPAHANFEALLREIVMVALKG